MSYLGVIKKGGDKYFTFGRGLTLFRVKKDKHNPRLCDAVSTARSYFHG